MKSYPIQCLCLVLLSVSLCIYVDAREGESLHIEATVYLTERHYIDGVSMLEREKYFNLHDSGQLPPERPNASHPDLLHLFTHDWNINFGRSGAINPFLRTDIPEDPNRPGYVDPSWYAQIRPMSSPMLPDHRERMGLIETSGAFPGFMLRDGLGPGATKSEIISGIKNPDAFAEYVVLLTRARLDQGWPIAYVELFNEPAGPWEADWSQLTNLYDAVAKKANQIIPEVGIGGPCFFDPFLFRQDFGVWHRQHQQFIDTTGANIDHLSFHFYDFVPDYVKDTDLRSDGYFATGGRREAELDLLENHAVNTHGRVLPIISSEFGGYNRTLVDVTIAGQSDPDNEEIRNWYMVNSVNRMLMTFIQRPTTVVKAIPFMLGYANWNSNYYSALLRPDGDGYRILSMAEFYRFWRRVDGERVRNEASDHNLAIFSAVKDNTVFVVLDNFYGHDIEVDLTLMLGDATVTAATVSRLYFDRQARNVTLTTDQPVDDLSRLILEGHEKQLLQLTLDSAPDWQRAIDEQWYYGDRTVVPIRRHTSESFRIATPSVDTIAYAKLRVAMGRPHHLSRQPEVMINGYQLQVPDYDWGGTQSDFQAHLTVKEMDVPVSVLQETNQIEVTFPDHGGDISTVILRLGHLLAPSEQGPYTIEHYENNMLAGEFATIAPANDAVSPPETVFRWHQALGATGYQLLVVTDPEFQNVTVNRVLAETEASVADLRYSQTYFWQVRALSEREIDAMDRQRFNSEGIMVFTTEDPKTIPPQPQLQRLVEGFGSVQLEWEYIRETDTYMLLRREHPEGKFLVINPELTRSENRFIDRNVQEGNTYWYKIIASNHLGESPPSDVVSVTIRPTETVIGNGFSQGFDERWRQVGSWSIRGEGDGAVANLRAIFPRAFGSIGFMDAVKEPLQVLYRLRPNSFGNPDLAVIRLSVPIDGSNRYQIMYWHAESRIELVRRTEAGGVLLNESPIRLQAGNWYDFRLQMLADEIKFFVNDALILSTTHQEPLPAGTMELYISNLDVDVSHLSLAVLECTQK